MGPYIGWAKRSAAQQISREYTETVGLRCA